MNRKIETFAFLSSGTPDSDEAAQELIKFYGQSDARDADVIVALGGDGFMLQTLQHYMNQGKMIYGMNRGSVGFLMNEFSSVGLKDRIEAAQSETIRPLKMVAESVEEGTVTAFALNEISLLRQSYQAAKIRISVDDQIRLEELICDGVMVATPAGSTAYNLSAQGPILPLDARLLALTPVSAFRPRRWRGALLPNKVTVRFDILEPEKRPVNAVADHTEVKSVLSVTIEEASQLRATILFDKNHSWNERILKEQFLY
ncbi:NAD+ kinase [Phyllobacterium ifriqiyense]|uniref:NAD kinase n=2 Tax=Phyllobacteriaceae TaxID=69277 RepID=A0ABU0SDS6_9HYPH|nr:NAD kinase [Phyllobacterium ifriqiyense]MDQ0998865.1 NAD+ kinase [Phyllobacterium ifriqiyense]